MQNKIIHICERMHRVIYQAAINPRRNISARGSSVVVAARKSSREIYRLHLSEKKREGEKRGVDNLITARRAAVITAGRWIECARASRLLEFRLCVV